MDSCKIVVGLGNPGARYRSTRHNAGFMVVERLAERRRVKWSFEKRFRADIAVFALETGKAILARPQTFMNASGEAVGALLNFYKIPLDQVLIILDDADLPLGQLRMRTKGGPGGHHGLESIEQQLNSPDYPRLRVGIGRRIPENRQITAHVLGTFSLAERGLMERVLNAAADQAMVWIADGPERAMNLYNGEVETASN